MQAPLLAPLSLLRELGTVVIAARDGRLGIQSAQGGSCTTARAFRLCRAPGAAESWNSGAALARIPASMS